MDKDSDLHHKVVWETEVLEIAVRELEYMSVADLVGIIAIIKGAIERLPDADSDEVVGEMAALEIAARELEDKDWAEVRGVVTIVKGVVERLCDALDDLNSERVKGAQAPD